MITVRHVTHPGKVYAARSMREAESLIAQLGGYACPVQTRTGEVLWDDFPQRNSFARPIEIPPFPLHLLRERME